MKDALNLRSLVMAQEAAGINRGRDNEGYPDLGVSKVYVRKEMVGGDL